MQGLHWTDLIPPSEGTGSNSSTPSYLSKAKVRNELIEIKSAKLPEESTARKPMFLQTQVCNSSLSTSRNTLEITSPVGPMESSSRSFSFSSRGSFSSVYGELNITCEPKERKRREAVWELCQAELVFLINHLMVLKHVWRILSKHYIFCNIAIF